VTSTIRKLRHWKQADAGWFRDLDLICFPAPDQTFFNSKECHWWVMEGGAAKGYRAYAGLYVLENTAHFCRCGVLPEYRGNNHQQELIKARLKWCRRSGVEIVRTHVAVHNIRSHNNLITCGFRGRKSKCGTMHSMWRKP